ncbi:HAD hydrolase-like protein [Haloechinothrix sp. LS1_15]|uniref:HAD-IIA family hydrolase n=1 Tax=Haloechinothrix sp. LS1_15 TaxID=2652248 RepID=UPI0029489AD6|nr:HAD hydrolase-like protein [Haloechinothrix sp. LS1_15]MDV6014756.1 HAD hydrolase-like protein [Haloechinothrix sp. LS1_15]
MSSGGLLLLDVEGTLIEHGRPLPGASYVLDAMRDQGYRIRFLTNIDSRPPDAIHDELVGIGLDLREGELFTPVTAARSLFAAHPAARVSMLLSSALRSEFADVALAPGDMPTHALIGDCRDVLDYTALDAAFRAVRAGAELVALQHGRYFKRPDGDHIDTGAVVAAVEYAAGVTARVLGKPSPEFFTLAAATAGGLASGCVVVGDDATTDIEGGRAVGAHTVRVRTGKFADQEAEGLSCLADHVVDSIADLPELLAQA